MGANDYFFPRKINIPHATPNYGPGKSKEEVDYYILTYCFPENWLVYEENWKKEGQ